MSKITETFFQRLENRLLPSEVRRAIKAFRYSRQKVDIGYMMVKEYSEIVEHYRNNAIKAVEELKHHCASQVVRDMVDVYRKREYRQLKQNAEFAISIYRDAKRDLADIRLLAVDKLKTPFNDNYNNHKNDYKNDHKSD